MQGCKCGWTGASYSHHVRHFVNRSEHQPVPLTASHGPSNEGQIPLRGRLANQVTEEWKYMPESHVEAMQFAISYLHEAEDSTSHAERVALTNLGHAWREVARELRLGKAKGGTYREITVIRPKPAPASSDGEVDKPEPLERGFVQT